ncbi:response regulator [Pseudenhygromyxa sp. WMMC2535]|nr:response regulator [Pseudenhygromyxa sp. WMMC2535]
MAEAVDGQQALEVFARERPDLVLLDVVMPRLTGLETCRILKAKAQGNYLPVIMVSTRNSVNARVEGLRSGADDYLGKPYDAEELRARVEALLRTRKVIAERAAAEGGDEEPPEEVPVAPAASARSRGDGESKGSRVLNEAFTRRAEEEFDRAERYSDPWLACASSSTTSRPCSSATPPRPWPGWCDRCATSSRSACARSTWCSASTSAATSCCCPTPTSRGRSRSPSGSPWTPASWSSTPSPTCAAR